MSSGFSPPRMRKKPALCSKVLAPRPATSSSCRRLLNAPWASRQHTTALATLADRPETRLSRGTLAGFRSTPTAFTQSSTTVPRVRASSLWFTSCWYWPTPMLLGSILTSSANGSCRRRAMLAAPRRLTSTSGSSCDAYSLAEYTEAPASLTTTLSIARPCPAACAIRSAASLSVSRLALPLPMAIRLTPCFSTSRANVRSAPSQSRRGSCGETGAVFTRLPGGSATATLTPGGMVGVEGGGFHQFAGGVDHGHFDAGADARVQPHHHTGAGRRGQQQVAQVVGKHFDGHLFGLLAQAGKQFALGREAEFDAPGPGHAFADQVVRRAARMAPAQVQRDPAFGDAGLARPGLDGQRQPRLQDLQCAPAEYGQRAVRGHTAYRLGVLEVVAELGHLRVVVVLAVELAAAQQALGPEPFAQALHQPGVFGPALGQDVAHPVEHGGHGGKIGLGLAIGRQLRRPDEGDGFLRRVQPGVGPEHVGQRRDAGFARDLALGAAFLLVRQVQVFEFLLGWRGGDRGAQRVGELALFGDALADGDAALLQLAQVRQARLHFAQLYVVQRAGRLLAIARDEGHRGTRVEQFHRCGHLWFPNPDFCGQLPNDLLHLHLRICGAPEKTRSARVCHTPHAQRGAPRPSPGIAQPCGNPVDRDVDSGLHALIILAGTPAAHQFDLQMVQRVDVCEAVLDGARQRAVVRQALLVAGDAAERIGGAVPFGLDGGKDLFAQARVADQFAVAPRH